MFTQVTEGGDLGLEGSKWLEGLEKLKGLERLETLGLATVVAKRALFSLSLTFLRFFWVLPNLIEFLRLLPTFSGFPGFQLVLHIFPDFYWILLTFSYFSTVSNTFPYTIYLWMSSSRSGGSWFFFLENDDYCITQFMHGRNLMCGFCSWKLITSIYEKKGLWWTLLQT